MLGDTHSGQVLAPRHVALILNREQGDGGAGKSRQVALTKLCEGLVGSPLQGVVEVIADGRGELGRHAWVRRVSRGVQVDLIASQTLGTGVHGTKESPCGQNGEARPRTRSESQDGATHRNKAIRLPRGWRRGSRPSINNKKEMNRHFIH
jgi:hypothetical protein